MVSARSSNLLLQGISASPGIAIGRARVTDRARIAVSEAAIRPDEVAAETKRFLDAVEQAKSELQLLKNRLELEKGAEHLYILDTHLMILDDPMLIRFASDRAQFGVAELASHIRDTGREGVTVAGDYLKK